MIVRSSYHTPIHPLQIKLFNLYRDLSSILHWSEISKNDSVTSGFVTDNSSRSLGYQANYLRRFIWRTCKIKSKYNRIGGVMVSILASRAVGRGFGSRLGQIKDYKICICCFSAFLVSCFECVPCIPYVEELQRSR